MNKDLSIRQEPATGKPLSTAVGLLLLAVVLGGLAVLGTWSSGRYYVIFHSLVELFSVAVAIGIFMIAWNVRHRMGNDFLLFVAIAYAAVCLVDLVHTLAYDGLGAIPGVSIDEPAQLWIAARYLQALCLLIAPLWMTRRLPCVPALILLGLIDALLLMSIFPPWPWWPHFPICRLGPPMGLTHFKVVSEYVISGILLLALGFLWLRRRRLDKEVFVYMAMAFVATMVSEIAFTSYVSVKSSSNLIGHLLKVIAVYLTYHALIAAGLKRPFDVLFRDLADSERRFRMLTAATFEGIAISEQGRLVDCNDQLADMLGYSREELIGRDIASIVHDEDRPRVVENIQRDAESHLEHRMRRKDGTCLVAEAHGQTVGDPSRRVRFTAIRDVTQRKAGEAALRHTADELVRSNKELEQFGYIISHDLQEPLRAVTSFLQLLVSRHGAELNPKAKEYVAFAVDGAQRMAQLIRDLLEYSRVQSKARQPAPADMKAAFEQAKANCQASIEESQATVTCGDLPTVMGDQMQLVQLLQNLIGNAIKFRRAGVRPEVHVGMRPEGEQCVFHVRDNGIGIAADQADRVFQLFHRLHSRQQYPGTGIGLAVCKKIVERHGGKIWMESKAGEGATFYFTLPEDRPA